MHENQQIHSCFCFNVTFNGYIVQLLHFLFEEARGYQP